MLKRTFLAAALIAGGLSMQACSDRGIAFGAGVVGGAILAGASHGHAYDYRNRNYCYDRYDGYYYCYDDNGYWHRRSRWHSDDGLEVMSKRGNVTADLVKKYQLSPYAAQTLVSTFEQYRADGKIEHLLSIGFTRGDLKRLSQGQVPNSYTIYRTATALRTSQDSIQDLLHDIYNEYSLQKQYDWKL
jgi:hypothetical protein